MGPSALMGTNILEDAYKIWHSRGNTCSDVVADYVGSTAHTKELRRLLRIELAPYAPQDSFWQ